LALASRRLSTDEIERILAQHPGGIAERYPAENRLHREVERSYGNGVAPIRRDRKYCRSFG
jgi:hypothetical protein